MPREKQSGLEANTFQEKNTQHFYSSYIYCWLCILRKEERKGRREGGRKGGREGGKEVEKEAQFLAQMVRANGES